MIQRLKILLVIMLVLMVSCGGGSGGDSSAIGDGTGDGGVSGNGLEDIGEAISDQLPGSVFYVSETDSYDVVFQVGATVMVVDSSTVSKDYQVKNTVYFDEVQ